MYLDDSDASSDSKYDHGFFLFDISYEWCSFIGTLVCVITGLAVSYLTRSRVDGVQTDPLLIFHFLRKFWGISGDTSTQSDNGEMPQKIEMVSTGDKEERPTKNTPLIHAGHVF